MQFAFFFIIKKNGILIVSWSILKFVKKFLAKNFSLYNLSQIGKFQKFMFNIIFQGKNNDIPQNFPKRGEIKKSVFKTLKAMGKYEIQSNVSEEVFLSFIEYLKGNVEPEINEVNKQEYLKLSKEFEIMGNLITNDEDEKNECLDNIKLLKNNLITDKSRIEELISKDLDNYLKICGEMLLESPIQSLFNIFSNKSKNFSDNNLCYNLIKHHYEKHQDITICCK